MDTWRFLIDENLEPRIATILRKEGHEAEHVTNVLGPGAADEEIVSYANREARVVLTNDVSDFRSIPVGDHAGLLLLHDGRQSAFAIANAVLKMVEAYEVAGGQSVFVMDAVDEYGEW